MIESRRGKGVAIPMSDYRRCPFFRVEEYNYKRVRFSYIEE